MPKPRRRLILVCLIVIALTIIVNSPLSEWALDAPVGLQWSANVVAFLKANTQGLIILVGFALLLEFTGIERSKNDDRAILKGYEKLSTMLLTDAPADVLVRVGLNRLYGDGADSLGRIVVPNRRPMRQTDILVRVKPSEAAGRLDIYHHVEFSWNGGSFLYAVVKDSQVAEGALSGIEELLECTAVADDGMTIQEFVKDMSAHVRFLLLPSDRSTPKQLTLKPLSARASERIAAKAAISPTDIALFRAEGGATGDRLRIEIRQTQSDDVNSVWWMADRPIEVRSLRLDATGLLPRKPVMDLTIFMGMSR